MSLGALKLIRGRLPWCSPTDSWTGGTVRYFTLADFMACDPRYAKHFAKVPAAKCNGDMLTVREWFSQNGNGTADHVPALMMVVPTNLDHDRPSVVPVLACPFTEMPAKSRPRARTRPVAISLKTS